MTTETEKNDHDQARHDMGGSEKALCEDSKAEVIIEMNALKLQIAIEDWSVLLNPEAAVTIINTGLSRARVKVGEDHILYSVADSLEETTNDLSWHYRDRPKV
jgi:hypothetical protein